MQIFKDIGNYSKQRKISLINAIEKANWDNNYNPEEFLQLLTEKKHKDWALKRMLAYMPYSIVTSIVTEEFLKENITHKIISQIYPLSRQKEVKRVYRKII